MAKMHHIYIVKNLKKIMTGIVKTRAQTCMTTKLTNKLANVFQTACCELIPGQ